MTEAILEIVKSRLNLLSEHQDTYLQSLIRSTIEELKETGIHVQDCARDIILVADMTVWHYQNRDKSGGMPEWLRLARRERFLQEDRR